MAIIHGDAGGNEMMRHTTVKLLSLFITSCALLQAQGSPLSNHLLPLVPDNAQIVAGMERVDDFSSDGRLFFTTRNCNRDLDDWMAVAGVDQSRTVDELIAVAGSTSSQELDQHLLLFHGHFDSARILKAELENSGSRKLIYKGYRVLEIAPLQRELKEMRDIRWLAILENQVVLFGTPKMVEASLERLTTRTRTDARLLSDLRRLRDDVQSWDVINLSGAVLARHLDTVNAQPVWSKMLNGADHVSIGVHQGRKTRVDFEISSTTHLEAFQPSAAFASFQPIAGEKEDFHIEKLAANENTITGSLVFAKGQFEAWIQSQFRNRIQRTDIPVDPIRP
jgi:hypothetical protein